MLNRSRRVVLAVSCSLWAVSAFADKISVSAAKVSVEAPRGWSVEQKDGGLTFYSKDKNVSAQFYAVPAGSVGKAEGTALKNLAAQIKNLRFGKERKFELNGLKGVQADGTGVLKGNPVSVSMTIFDTPSEQSDLMLVAIGVEAVLAAHKADIEFLFQHVQPEA